MHLPQKILLLAAASGFVASCRDVTGSTAHALRWAAAAAAPSLVVSADRDLSFSAAFPARLAELTSAAPSRQTIVDADRWSLLLEWLEAHIAAPPPAQFAVDWEHEMVLYAQSGRAPSQGYALSITHVAEVRDTVFALVERERPGLGCAPLERAMQPKDARLVQRRALPVVFLEREWATSCISGKRERLR